MVRYLITLIHEDYKLLKRQYLPVSIIEQFYRITHLAQYSFLATLACN